MSGMTLYEVLDDLVALQDTIDMCETPEQRAECEAALQRAIDAQIRKVDNFNRFLSHLESQVDLAEKEIKRLKAREAVFANLQERLEKYAIFVMQQRGLRKLDGDTSSLTLRVNAPGVDIDDEAAVPGQFKTIRQEVAIDRRGIKKAIDAGEEVPGAHLREPSVSLIRK